MAAIGDTVKVHLRGATTWRRVGDAAKGVAHATGLNIIARRLSAAAEGDDGAALSGFRQADQIRIQLGCSWADLITGKTP